MSSRRDARLLRDGYLSCERVTRAHARSFSLASVALGAERRRGAFAVYAFCRRADDAVDEAEGAGEAELLARVDALRAQLDAVYSFRPLEDPQLCALRDTARRFGLERRPFDELLEGIARDTGPVALETDEDLDRYCYLVAGTVGLMMARLFGVRHDGALQNAVDLGRAMQLTNVLRDVREDLRERDRVYLPKTLLTRYGLTREDLGRDHAPEPLRALVRELIARADALYRSADEGVPLIVSSGGRGATAIMRAVYSEILRVIEARDCDVLAGRAVVSRARKAALLVRALSSVSTTL